MESLLDQTSAENSIERFMTRRTKLVLTGTGYTGTLMSPRSLPQFISVRSIQSWRMRRRGGARSINTTAKKLQAVLPAFGSWVIYAWLEKRRKEKRIVKAKQAVEKDSKMAFCSGVTILPIATGKETWCWSWVDFNDNASSPMHGEQKGNHFWR